MFTFKRKVIEKYLMMRVTFDVFVICLMSFVGWIMLSIFSSIGLVALPMDLIRGFTKRPK
jgi:hypothetical protein